jgi:hypothetical protein
VAGNSGRSTGLMQDGGGMRLTVCRSRAHRAAAGRGAADRGVHGGGRPRRRARRAGRRRRRPRPLPRRRRSRTPRRRSTTPRPPDVVLDVDVARLTSAHVRDVVPAWHARLPGVDATVAALGHPCRTARPTARRAARDAQVTDRIERLAGECPSRSAASRASTSVRTGRHGSTRRSR